MTGAPTLATGSADAGSRLRIDVWSDLVCPFCWIGKHRLETAIARLGLQDDVEVVFRAFELNPTMGSSVPLRGYLARKFGGDANARAMSERVEQAGARDGLAFDWDRAVAASTLRGHRLVHLAQTRGLGSAMTERIMRAHFAEGRDVAEAATLRDLALEAGLDGAEVDELLASTRFLDNVREDEALARGLGIGGVPFFLLGERYAVSGAQSVETFEHALRTALAPAEPETA